jgi:hypothetical protein
MPTAEAVGYFLWRIAKFHSFRLRLAAPGLLSFSAANSPARTPALLSQPPCHLREKIKKYLASNSRLANIRHPGELRRFPVTARPAAKFC